MRQNLERLLGQVLLIDADDTLWENNVYFEQAIADFIAYLDHHTHSAAEVRAVLNRCEHATIAEHGYGTASFERSLTACFAQVSQLPVSAENSRRISGFARSIADRVVELLPAVAETLPLLAERHRLILVTKGCVVEQQEKLDRSGLHAHFTAVEIPREKDAGAYRAIAARHALDPAATWMIGNSPRSDINPALEAGLHAVYLHHPHTWELEHETLAEPTGPQRLLEVAGFGALLEHF